MEVLYISKLSSRRLLNLLFTNNNLNSGFAVQKFSRLITRGFVLNGVNCHALSSLPDRMTRKLLKREPSETEDGVTYHYIPIVRMPILRHIVLFVHSFFFTMFWCLKTEKNKAIVCDVLDISICLGSLLSSKICGVKSVGVMTDMPGLMVRQGQSLLWKTIAKINMSYIRSFSGYVFLTQQMNDCINTKKRPYIIMEGLVDSEMVAPDIVDDVEAQRIVMYAGGLHERYGLKMLVDAFVSVGAPDAKLVIYGKGPYENELLDVCSRNISVEYRGVALNDSIVEEERRATLLVNPRPTHEDFTKYSFPSKNMEYMVSGTPLLTTKLPGMPKEYYDYVYLFDEESEGGYAATLKQILGLPSAELKEKGIIAQEYVIRNKNNKIQSERIINLIMEINS